MGLFDFLNRSPDMYGNLFGTQRPLVAPPLPEDQMKFGISNAMATPEPPGGLLGSLGSSIGSLFGGGGQQPKGKIQDLAEEMGLPKPQEQWKTLLPVLLTQVGAALLQPPGPQRAAVFAQLPATMLAAQKMNREDAQNRALMGVYKEKIKAESKADPFALEEHKQAGREALQRMRDENQSKRDELRSIENERRLTAQEERLKMQLTETAANLDKRLEFMGKMHYDTIANQNERQNKQLAQQWELQGKPKPPTELQAEAGKYKRYNQALKYIEKFDAAPAGPQKEMYKQAAQEAGAIWNPETPGNIMGNAWKNPGYFSPPPLGGGAPAAAGTGKGQPTVFKTLPDPAKYKGRTLNNGQLISNGTEWVPNVR